MSQHDQFLYNPTHEQVENLFDFDVIKQPMYTVGANGQLFEVEGRTCLVTSDRPQVLGVPKDSFEPYSYKQMWSDARTIVNGGGDVVTKGAGLLYDRGVGFVQVGLPESIKSRSGVAFDPFLLGTTSFNGMFRTIWGDGKIIVVCRNTHAAASKAAQRKFSRKHTKNSEFTVDDIKNALGILTTLAEGEAEYIDRLVDVRVTDDQFEAFLAKLIPSTEDAKPGRADTIRDKKRDTIWQLFQTDVRCQPDHTAWSALQATNTYNHHFATIRGEADRDVRNMENYISGKMGESDELTLRTLEKILSRELVAA